MTVKVKVRRAFQDHRVGDIISIQPNQVQALATMNLIDPVLIEDEPEDGGTDLSKLSVAALKDLAAQRGVDLGDATKKADIIAALELAAEQ